MRANMRAERVSTIGTERLTNYALQIESREEFVEGIDQQYAGPSEYFFAGRGNQSPGAPAFVGSCQLCLAVNLPS